MSEERLYIINASGNDSVGLVGKITSALAKINGNIVDLRQDVMHGLFTIYLVVDLKESSINFEDFKKLIDEIAEITNLKIYVDKYSPVPRDPEKKNILLILLGNDRPGITARISESLSKYQINIEFSQMIAREDIFFMDLLADISKCTLPLSNLENVLKETMTKMDINTLFQTKDVFNKKKRVIIFNIQNTFIDKTTIKEIVEQTSINKEFNAIYPDNDIQSCIKKAASNLDGLPIEVLNNIIEKTTITSGTIELLQTLKTMGYKIALASPSLSIFLEYLKKKIDIDHFYGYDLYINEDTKTISKEINLENTSNFNIDSIISQIIEIEKIDKEDITIISDTASKQKNTPGIKCNFDLKIILEYFNQHILNKDYILGILGSFGIPSL